MSYYDFLDNLENILFIIVILLIFGIIDEIFSCIDYFNTRRTVLENKTTFEVYHTCYKFDGVYYCK